MLKRIITDWLAPRLIGHAWSELDKAGVPQPGGDEMVAYVDLLGADLVIGSKEDPYLLRWWLLPRNSWFNLYLHLFLRSDDDRALHDHEYPNLSVLLAGAYTEHTIAAGGVNRRVRREAGEVKFRLPWSAHRIELTDGPCWTVFVTGPRIRKWGFHCPKGWVPWDEFTSDDGVVSGVGKGCGELA